MSVSVIDADKTVWPGQQSRCPVNTPIKTVPAGSPAVIMIGQLGHDKQGSQSQCCGVLLELKVSTTEPVFMVRAESHRGLPIFTLAGATNSI